MACSLVFYSTVFSSSESLAAGHISLRKSPEGSSSRSRNVRFRRCFNVRATQVSAGAAATSGSGHMKGQSLYEVLGVSQGATARDIKMAYRKLAKEFHPDHAPSPQERVRKTQMFMRINSAYVTLSDPHDRAQYDRQLSDKVRGFAGHSGQTWSKATEAGYRDWSGRLGRNWETDQCW